MKLIRAAGGTGIACQKIGGIIKYLFSLRVITRNNIYDHLPIFKFKLIFQPEQAF